MNETTIKPGDLYCPDCLGEDVIAELSHGDLGWHCGHCQKAILHSFEAGPDGRFQWIWDTEHPKPNPGCPWCGTCNLRIHCWLADTHTAEWFCQREDCRKSWTGRYSVRVINGEQRFTRWLIRMPVCEVTWVSGTLADLECWRRLQTPTPESYNPYCCRFPKSCRAYDPGFTTGKGRTTLPIVWFDGVTGWRSGPPDVTSTPEHLIPEILRRWEAVRPREEASDDDRGCGQGCEYICRCF